jgi:hypothetical protein
MKPRKTPDERAWDIVVIQSEKIEKNYGVPATMMYDFCDMVRKAVELEWAKRMRAQL